MSPESETVTRIAHDQEVARVVAVVAGRLAPEPSPTAARDALLVDDLGYHSLALVELTFLLEELFELGQIDPQAAAEIRTVGDISDYLLSSSGEAIKLPDEATLELLLADFSPAAS